MGWCSGAYLFDEICKEASKYIKEDNEFEVFVRKNVKLFEDADADTLFDDIERNRLGKVMKKIAKERGYF
jgi:hypothetical protein